MPSSKEEVRRKMFYMFPVIAELKVGQEEVWGH